MATPNTIKLSPAARNLGRGSIVYSPVDIDSQGHVVPEHWDMEHSVSSVSSMYNISSKTIYAWLREGVVDGNRNLILENNKLKKELEIAYRILGRLTAETKRPKD